MPFSLSNEPTTFKALKYQISQFELRKFVLVFFDDILVYNTNWDAQLQHLETVLSSLNQHK